MQRTLIMVVAVAALFSGGVFYWYYAQSTPDTIDTTDAVSLTIASTSPAVEMPGVWHEYRNDAVGFSFSYPPNAALVETVNRQYDGLQVTVDTQDIRALPQDGPLNMDKTTAVANRTALASGQYGSDVDMPYPDSRLVRTVAGRVNAQDFIVLGRFEVCSVTFEHKLYFIHKDTQIIITLYGPVATIESEAPGYFTTNTTNCGSELVWDYSKQSDFYQALIHSTLTSPHAQAWQDTFNQLADTVNVY